MFVGLSATGSKKVLTDGPTHCWFWGLLTVRKIQNYLILIL